MKFESHTALRDWHSKTGLCPRCGTGSSHLSGMLCDQCHVAWYSGGEEASGESYIEYCAQMDLRRSCLCGSYLPDDDSYACETCVQELIGG